MMNHWINTAFEEFGRTLGVGNRLAPDSTGGLSVQFENERELSFQVLDEAVLVLLARPLPPGDQVRCKSRALWLCHLGHNWQLPVRAGITRDGRLVFMTRIPSRQFVVPTIEQACELLTRLHEQANH